MFSIIRNRTNDRNKPTFQNRQNESRIDLRNFPNPSQFIRKWLAHKQISIATAQPHRIAPGFLNLSYQSFIGASSQRHFNDFHGLIVRDSQSIHDNLFNAQLFKPIINFWSPTMHQHRLDSH